jgi:hypothetical protein
MNERIKELMDDAVTFRLDPDSNAYEAQVSPEDLELFAELIVQECCDWIDGVPSTDGGMLLLTKSFIIVNLKDKFNKNK